MGEEMRKFDISHVGIRSIIVWGDQNVGLEFVIEFMIWVMIMTLTLMRTT
jgi:hypothetical protein